MKEIDKIYCQAAIRAVLRANLSMCESTIYELLQPSESGKKDTLGLDIIPEIMIGDEVRDFDPRILFLTEETGKRQSLLSHHQKSSTSIVFVCDPTDRSSFLKKFLRSFGEKEEKLKFKEVVSRKKTMEKWKSLCGGGPVSIAGATSAITGIKEGKPLFSVILNYITQDMVVASEAGIKIFSIKNWPLEDYRRITFNQIVNESNEINFSQERKWNYSDYQTYLTFLGKSGYKENFENSKIFLPEFMSEEKLIYNQPGGPSRILYLSSLYDETKTGFILANGEKIVEWIHWLPFLAVKQSGKSILKMYEISYDRPYTKEGILMAVSPIYSIFSHNEQGDSFLKLSKLEDFPNPTRYRATLLVTFPGNDWVSQRMQRSLFREIKFKF